jgi:hypothetical protein
MSRQLIVGNQGRTHQVGAYQGSFRGRERIAYQDLPSIHEIEQILEQLTANITLRTEDIPKRPITLPPIYTELSEIDVYTEMARLDLQYDDLRTDKPRTASLARLCKALCIGRYIALGNQPPLQYKSWALVCPMNFENPDMPHGEQSHLAVDNSTKFIIKSMKHRDTIKDASGKTGHMIIPELYHYNNCMCASDCIANNQESLHFLRICAPRSLRQQYAEADHLPDARNAVSIGKKYGNSHTVYYSSVSVSGTVTPQMICRQPITELTRKSPIFRTPQYSHVDMSNDLHLIRAIGACLSRQEIHQYTKNFTESCKMDETTEETGNLYRFPKMNRNRQNTDILSLNPSYNSLDQALANEPLVEPFMGPQACPYCPTILQITEPKDYLLHLFDHHAILTEAYFTCPGCIAICIFNKETYPAHYTEVHSQASALIIMFTETATHIRTQQALQLSLFIEVTLRLESFYPAEKQNKEPHYVSYLGGYSSNKKALFREVQNEQIKRNPLDLMHQMEETLSADFTTTEEIFNIQRPSSPIFLKLLKQIKNNESYSEKTKQRTTFEEKETEKDTRTDRQPRQQNKFKPTEPQTPQRKRRAEVNSPERPMSVSPSPRRSPPRRTPRRSPSSRRRASRTPDRPTATKPTTARSLSRKASRRSPSRAEYRNPSPRRTRTTDSREDYHYSYRPSPEYQTPDSSPSARRRANLYTSSSTRNKME